LVGRDTALCCHVIEEPEELAVPIGSRERADVVHSSGLVNGIKNERNRKEDQIQFDRAEIALAPASPVITGELTGLE
jgi:hypothetical protein